MKKNQVICPHCGKTTSSYKVSSKLSRLLIGFFVNNWKYEPVSGCRTCLAKQYGSGLISNLLFSHIFWPLFLVIQFIGFLRYLIPGHSTIIKQSIKNSSLSNNLDSKEPLLPGVPPPHAIASSIMTKRALKKAKRNHSFLWALKARSYQREDIFFTSIDGSCISINNSGLIVIENDRSSTIFYRDFIKVPSSYFHLRQELENTLEQWSDVMEFEIQSSYQEIRIHAKPLYTVDFNDDIVGQINWIESEIQRYANECLKWFNSAKLR